MNYDIAISRLATFVHPAFCRSTLPPALGGDALYAKFFELADSICRHPAFTATNEETLGITRAIDRNAELEESVGVGTPDGIGELAVFDIAGEYPEAARVATTRDTLVARMPSQRIRVLAGDTRWILRTRAHVTSCVYEGNTRPTKLWWTFEGIPADTDPGRRPNDDDVSALLGLTAKIEENVRDSLVRAFTESLAAATSPKPKVSKWRQRLNITLTECSDDEVDALLDAMYFDDKTPSEIKKSRDAELQEARDGMKYFENFIHNVLGERAQVDDDSLSVTDDLPKVKGILWHHRHIANQLVAGVARRAGVKIGLHFMTDEERRRQFSEERLRLRSAARPLSAYLANSEAVALEKRVRHPHLD